MIYRNITKRRRKNKILILCQGKTEEIYFKSFPVVQAGREWSINVIVESYSLDPEQLVIKAIAAGEEAEQYNTIWCVFDKDDFKQNFRKGLILADKENIRTAFTIESFELWLLLHFQRISIDSPLNRESYITELNKPGRLAGYTKIDSSIRKYISYTRLGKIKTAKAVSNSKELETKAKSAGRFYSKQNCTIHRLVEYLEALK